MLETETLDRLPFPLIRTDLMEDVSVRIQDASKMFGQGRLSAAAGTTDGNDLDLWGHFVHSSFGFDCSVDTDLKELVLLLLGCYAVLRMLDEDEALKRRVKMNLRLADSEQQKGLKIQRG